MFVSVLIPTNNVSEKTVKTVKSINYHDVNFEIILVIDAVSNIDFDQLDHLKKDNRVRIIISHNRPGIASTLNLGLEVALGDIIVRLDDGDINLRKDLNLEIAMLSKFDLVCGSMLVGSHSTERLVIPRIINWSGRIGPFSILPHPTWVLKKNSIKKNYALKDFRCEDYGLIVRNKLRVGIADKVVCKYETDNYLNFFKELKSLYAKTRIGFQDSKNLLIICDYFLYVILRILRLTITTKKVVQSEKRTS